MKAAGKPAGGLGGAGGMVPLASFLDRALTRQARGEQDRERPRRTTRPACVEALDDDVSG